GREAVGRSYVRTAFQRRQLLLDLVDGNGEADPNVSVDWALDRSVDADHFALRVHQWATRVAGVDGGVGLDQPAQAAPVRGRTTLLEVGDDPLAQRSGEAERRTDRVDRVAHLRAVGIPERDRMKPRCR